MKRHPLLLRILCLSEALIFVRCDWVIHLSQSLALRERQQEIVGATAAVERAKGVKERAQALATRGRAYSEKARYGRAFKLLAPDEYHRLIALALTDHNEAVSLDGENADILYARGYSHHDRASLDLQEKKDASVALEAAAADFARAVELNATNAQAWDMLGITHQSMGRLDLAIED